MGIPAPLAKFILSEHCYQPITGQVLSLGRQTVLFDANTLHKMMNEYCIPMQSTSQEIDTLTVEAKLTPEMNYIMDSSFYAAFTDACYHVMDMTDYEGATIIHDLCKPIPNHLLGQFDFIFNGSVLDNIFDPAAALRHITDMLTLNGRVMHIEMASNLAFEYLIYSPDWFLDYYVVNGFYDCKIYICTFNDINELKFGPWNIYRYGLRDGGHTACSLREVVTQHAVIVVIAEKQPTSTAIHSPTQWCYRDKEMKRCYAEAYARFNQDRPLFLAEPYDKPTNLPEGFTYLGKIA